MKYAFRSAVKGKLIPLITLITTRFLYTSAVKHSSLHSNSAVKRQRPGISDTVLLVEDILDNQLVRKRLGQHW